MNVHMDIERFFSSIWSMNTDQIAIVSLIITLLLFALGKHSENKLKIMVIQLTPLASPFYCTGNMA